MFSFDVSHFHHQAAVVISESCFLSHSNDQLVVSVAGLPSSLPGALNVSERCCAAVKPNCKTSVWQLLFLLLLLNCCDGLRSNGVIFSLSLSLPPDVDFNVSGMFAMPAPASNHNNHLDYDSGTMEKKKPGSLVAPESEASRKEKLAATKFLQLCSSCCSWCPLLRFLELLGAAGVLSLHRITDYTP